MDNNLLLRVRSLARTVRDWTEVQDNTRPAPSLDLNGWCAIASAELSVRFAREGIPHEICMAESGNGCHVFVLVDDHVVDVTATQFGSEFRELPVVIRHHRELAWYWFYDIRYVFSDAAALREHQVRTGWPIDQTAFLQKEKLTEKC